MELQKLQELSVALSLNRAQLARILRVTESALCNWFQGIEPNADSIKRLHILHAISHTYALNARFVRKSIDPNVPSLLELLNEENLDEEKILLSIRRVQDLGDLDAKRRREREDRLRSLGFEDLSNDLRRKQLATNIALLNGPKKPSCQ